MQQLPALVITCRRRTCGQVAAVLFMDAPSQPLHWVCPACSWHNCWRPAPVVTVVIAEQGHA